MDFTREPIIETIITPKEGCKLVVRSSKSSGQEEFFVDAVEVVSFGSSFFFRSTERPKSFLVPASDYEVLEVREARMVLKNVGTERTIKIGGGREQPQKAFKEEKTEAAQATPEAARSADASASPQGDRKRERRSRYRRGKRGREEALKDEAGESSEESKGEFTAQPAPTEFIAKAPSEPSATPTGIVSSILPPPPTLISETIARYKDNALFKGAFFSREEQAAQEAADAEETPHEISIEKEEEIVQHRDNFTFDDMEVEHFAQPPQPPAEEPIASSDEPPHKEL